MYKNYLSFQFARTLKDVIAKTRLFIFPTIKASNSLDVTYLPNAKGFYRIKDVKNVAKKPKIPPTLNPKDTNIPDSR